MTRDRPSQVEDTDRRRRCRGEAIRTRKRGRAHGRPAVDVAETDDQFGVAIELPGFDRDDIDVRVTDNTLHVSAECSGDASSDDVTYLRRERPRKPQKRTINLPQEVDEDETDATFENGVLAVTLGKDEEEQPGHYVPLS